MRAYLALSLLLASVLSQQPAPVHTGETVYVSPGGIRLRLMLDETNVGKEVTLGEMTFPPNLDSGEHQHGAIEMFYVLSGALEHVVNGKSITLTAGMTGFVRPPDRVRHKTGPEGAKAVVIWVPGDEASKIVARWKREYPSPSAGPVR